MFYRNDILKISYEKKSCQKSLKNFLIPILTDLKKNIFVASFLDKVVSIFVPNRKHLTHETLLSCCSENARENN